MSRRVCPFSGLDVAVIDCEFYYAQDYSLSLMPTAEFMLDPRFELMITTVELEIGKPEQFIGDHKACRQWIQQFDLGTKLVAAHSGFIEGSILEWRLKVKPVRYWCTLAASRPFFVPWTNSASLESLAKHFALIPKAEAVRKKMKGKHLADLSPEQVAEYATYNMDDVRITAAVYDKEVAKFLEWNPNGDEAELIDLTVKKFTRPRLMLDRPMLQEVYQEVRTNKAELLAKAGVGKDVLMSDAKLEAELVKRGVKPEYKFSKKKQAFVPAFAKTDKAFTNLTRFTSVGPLVRARLAFKSTIEETRLSRFEAIAKAANNVMPCPLLYYGAHTGRWSGQDKLNLQNLGRGSRLRATLIAPPGYVVLAGDLSQIEARITACLAGQWDLLEDFRSGADPYARFASTIYGRPIEPKAKTVERLVGKVGILSLGYMTGWETLHHTLNNVHGVVASEQECKSIIQTYRVTYGSIPQLWTTIENIIPEMTELATRHELGPLVFGYQQVVLPNGMPIFYRELQRAGNRKWVYFTGRVPKNIFAGSVLENIASGSARVILSAAELRVWRTAGQRAVLQVHDELVYVVREREAESFKELLTTELTRSVSWMPRLPIACEVNYGRSYLDTK